jgi:hypothetical protein
MAGRIGLDIERIKAGLDEVLGEERMVRKDGH